MRPATRLALALVLFSLLLDAVVGFPVARQALAKSAHGDDLISGSDFLSVFIGATVPRPRPANRSHGYNIVTERPGSVPSEEPITRTGFSDDSYETDSDKLRPSESIDLGNKVIANLASFVSHLENDLDSIPNSDVHKSFLPNAPEDGVHQNGDTEPIGQSSITTSKNIEYLPDTSKDNKPEEGTTLPPTTSNFSFPTLGIESAQSTFIINSEPVITEDSSENVPPNSTEESEITPSSQETEGNFEDAVTPAILLDPSPVEEDQNTQNETHKVISVRVSSSVARLAPPQQGNKIDNDNKDVFSTFLNAFSETADKEGEVQETENISLVTEEQPAATAIQRSQFSVEEASPSSSIISVHHESSSSRKSAPASVYSQASVESAPVSYHTSVSSATSGSRVQFYSEPSSYHRVSSSVAETVQRSVVANHPLQDQQQSYGQPATVFQRDGPLEVGREQPQQHFQQQPLSDNNRSQKSFQTPHHEPQEANYEVAEQHYGTPEKSYSRPEQNYEVDESVSVMSNGRAHGVQYPPATTPAQVEDTGLRDFSTQPGETRDPNSKFGYVVEGRNFRKYRVEERTPDGFIVGEYGVVSHDDGSLRGVRYTADGTINPRLIYDALVKFLSL